MDKHFLDSTSPDGKAVYMAALRFDLQQEAQEDSLFASASASHPPRWPLITAIVALLGMLLVFHYVVRGAMRHSEFRHKEMALNAEAIWRCNNLQGQEASRTCLLQVNAEARKAALLRSQKAPWLHE